MPLRDVADAPAEAAGTRYLLFFASGSPPWCPDCRDALPAIEQVFGAADAPELQVIKIGMRDEWKSIDNKWRGPPFHVSETPTILKTIDSKEVKRLGDQACKSVFMLKELVAMT